MTQARSIVNDLERNGASSSPSVVDSIIRVLEAGQRIIIDRIDLARFDLGNGASRALYGAAFAIIGAALLTTGWIALLAALVIWLQDSMSLPASLLVGAGVSAGAGAGAIAHGLRRARLDLSATTAEESAVGARS